MRYVKDALLVLAGVVLFPSLLLVFWVAMVVLLGRRLYWLFTRTRASTGTHAAEPAVRVAYG
jgi:hypothetical protein